MNDFTKNVLIGTTTTMRFSDVFGMRKQDVCVYVRVTYTNGNLSITGVEGPKSNGDCHGSCGQIILGFKEYDPRGYKTLEAISPVPQWDAEKIKRLFDIWDRWHMNNMCAGTPAQTQYLKNNRPKAFVHDYTAQCNLLEAAGLLTDNGYTYGSQWLKEEVPQDVLTWLKELPQADPQPIWC